MISPGADMLSVDLLDRSAFVEQLKAGLQIVPAETAVVAVDLCRGHLDPEVATLPVPTDLAAGVIDATGQLFALARAYGIPIIHVVTTQRNLPNLGHESWANPFRRAWNSAGLSVSATGKATAVEHNLEGAPGCEIVPRLAPTAADFIVNTKRRLSAFHGTDLEALLRMLGVTTLLIAGVNTNTCVECAVFEAHNRDFAPVVVAECVASMYGQDLHLLALENIARCLGWVLTLDEVRAKLR
jgi:nicotinamidase-related amidase